MRFGLALAAVTLIPAQAMAQANEPSPASERRLSPEQIETVLAEAARKREAADPRPDVEADGQRIAPPVQGEFGVSVGTGGYREIFGTGIYPMGNDGVAIISLDFVDLGKRRQPR